MREWIGKHKSMLAYLFFGGITTVVNILTYGVCARLGMSTGLSNIIAWILAVAVAYITNRVYVFKSENHTLPDIIKEIVAFVACRVGTGVIDQIIMVVGTDVIGPQIIPAEYLYIWGLLLKVASNVLVIVLNYIFSKVFIYKKKS